MNDFLKFSEVVTYDTQRSNDSKPLFLDRSSIVGVAYGMSTSAIYADIITIAGVYTVETCGRNIAKELEVGHIKDFSEYEKFDFEKRL